MNYRIYKAISLQVGDTVYHPIIDVTVEKITYSGEYVLFTYTDGTTEEFHWRDLLFVSCPHRRYSERYI